MGLWKERIRMKTVLIKWIRFYQKYLSPLKRTRCPYIPTCSQYGLEAITYLLLTPLQIKQQKMSKMMSIIQPEIQKIQKKYQGKRDQATQMKIQEETMGLYQKYGISPTGSCLPLLIQLPILFGLYQVIYHIPGYISKVANIFSGLANEIIGISNSHEVLTAFAEANKISVSFGDSLTQTKVIDFLYMLKPNQWDNLAQVQQFGSLQPMITDVAGQSERINSFLGINISQSPWDVIQSGIAAGTWLLVIAAVLVPVLAWFTQWLNYKLMPQQSTAANPNDSHHHASFFGVYLCDSVHGYRDLLDRRRGDPMYSAGGD